MVVVVESGMQAACGGGRLVMRRHGIYRSCSDRGSHVHVMMMAMAMAPRAQYLAHHHDDGAPKRWSCGGRG